jgi:hypothetical protein
MRLSETEEYRQKRRPNLSVPVAKKFLLILGFDLFTLRNMK